MTRDRATDLVRSAKQFLSRFEDFDTATIEDFAHEVLLKAMVYENKHGRAFTQPVGFAVVDVLKAHHDTTRESQRLKCNERLRSSGVESLPDAAHDPAAFTDFWLTIKTIFEAFSERDQRMIREYLVTAKGMSEIAATESLTKTSLCGILRRARRVLLENLLPTSIITTGEPCR